MSKTWNLAVAVTAVLIWGLCLGARVRPDGFDNAGYSLTARSIVLNRTSRVDPIVGHLPALGACGAGDCQVVTFQGRTYALTARGDALYNYYPIGTSIIILPAAAIALASGYDIIGENALHFEHGLAAISVILSYIFIYLIFRKCNSPFASWLWSTGFVLASPIISTMGSALWSSNFAVVLDLASLSLLLYRDLKGSLVWTEILAFLSFLSYLCKPTSLLLAVFIAIYILIKYKKHLVYYIFTLSILFILFVVYSFNHFGGPLPPYYSTGSWGSHFTLEGLTGVLLSPSRGLLVYQPYLIVVLVLVLRYRKQLVRDLLSILSGSTWLIFTLSVVSMTVWWGGFCFGSRLMTEAFPFIILLSAKLWQTASQQREKSVSRLSSSSLAALFIAGALINTGQGLYNPQVLAWNGISGESFSINKNKEYLWSWRYPQFLASEESIRKRNQEAAQKELQESLSNLTNYSYGTIIEADSPLAAFDNWLNVERSDSVAWRWANGDSATLWIRLPEAGSEPIHAAKLIITGNPYTPYSVDVYLNGACVGLIENDHMWPADSFSFFIENPSILRFNDYNSIEFRTRQQVIPQEDGHRRSFYLQSLLLEIN